MAAFAIRSPVRHTSSRPGRNPARSATTSSASRRASSGNGCVSHDHVSRRGSSVPSAATISAVNAKDATPTYCTSVRSHWLCPTAMLSRTKRPMGAQQASNSRAWNRRSCRRTSGRAAVDPRRGLDGGELDEREGCHGQQEPQVRPRVQVQGQPRPLPDRPQPPRAQHEDGVAHPARTRPAAARGAGRAPSAPASEARRAANPIPWGRSSPRSSASGPRLARPHPRLGQGQRHERGEDGEQGAHGARNVGAGRPPESTYRRSRIFPVFLKWSLAAPRSASSPCLLDEAAAHRVGRAPPPPCAGPARSPPRAPRARAGTPDGR